MREKIKRHIISFFTNSLLHNIINIIALILLMLLVLLFTWVPVANFWNKVLATCYVIAVMALVVLFRMPKVGRKIGFNEIGVCSFAIWCVIAPIIAGILMTVLVGDILQCISIDDLGFWLMAIFITIMSFAWFLTKLRWNKDVTSYLDLYSTIWIALVTILTTLFDLQEKKDSFVFLLTMYFVLQLFIKGKICKIQEKRNVG